MSDMRDAARRVAAAIRDAGEDDEPADGGRYRASVTRWQSQSEFRLDVHGVDLELDEDDVVLGQSVRRYDADVGIEVGDALVLLEVGDSDFVAVEVESENA